MATIAVSYLKKGDVICQSSDVICHLSDVFWRLGIIIIWAWQNLRVGYTYKYENKAY